MVKKEVNLSALPREQKARVWRRLREVNPALADFLEHDDVFRALRAKFGGDVIVTADQLMELEEK